MSPPHNLKDAIHVGHSTGGGEVVRYIGRHGTSRVATAVLIAAIRPLMLKTDRAIDLEDRQSMHAESLRPRSAKQSRWTWAGVLWLPLLLSCSQPPNSTTGEAGRAMTNDSLLEVRHVSVSIDRPPGVVYQFAATPENMPRWAVGLGTSFRPRGDGSWIAEGGPVGRATVRFVERNSFGVLDHDVTIETGETVHNPIRVLPNGAGSEVVFTLFRRPGVSTAEFEQDAQAVEKDLRTLKRLVESGCQVGAGSRNDSDAAC